MITNVNTHDYNCKLGPGHERQPGRRKREGGPGPAGGGRDPRPRTPTPHRGGDGQRRGDGRQRSGPQRGSRPAPRRGTATHRGGGERAQDTGGNHAADPGGPTAATHRGPGGAGAGSYVIITTTIKMVSHPDRQYRFRNGQTYPANMLPVPFQISIQNTLSHPAARIPVAPH